MLKWILPLLLATSATSVDASLWSKVKNAFASEEAKVPSVRVLIDEEKEGVMLQVTGAHNIYDPYSGDRLATRFTGKTAFIQPINEGIKWGEIFPKTYQLHFVPDHENSTLLVDGVQYEGSVYIYAVDGKLNIVNEVPVENYLLARLAADFPQPMDEEALNALAIVARTDAAYHVQSKKNKFWDVRAQDIGFKGYTYAQNVPHIAKAVKLTRGMMLNSPGTSEPFAARWTKHSAGRTAPYHVMFRRDEAAPVTGVHSRIAEQNRDETEWTYSVDREEIARLSGLESLSDITLHADEESGKIFAVHLSDGLYSKDMDFVSFQEALGASNLKSSDFLITTDETSVTFHGVGEGHGVGLCLYSAKKMASKGASASEILNAFFPSTHVAIMPEKRAKPVAPAKAKRRRPRHNRA